MWGCQDPRAHRSPQHGSKELLALWRPAAKSCHFPRGLPAEPTPMAEEEWGWPQRLWPGCAEGTTLPSHTAGSLGFHLHFCLAKHHTKAAPASRKTGKVTDSRSNKLRP